MCLGLDLAVVGPTLPNLAGQTGTSVGEVGLIFFLAAAGGSVGTVLSGWILDKAPGRLVLGGAQIIAGSLFLLVPHVRWYGLLLVIFVCKGVVGGLVGSSANTLLQWVHREKSGPFVNALHFFFGLGAFVSPFLLGLLLTVGLPYSVAFTLLAIADVTVGAAVLARLPSPETPPAHPRQVGADASTRSYLAPLVIAAMLFLFFYVSAELTFGGWLYTYALNLGLADAARAAYLTSLFWLAFTIGRLISIPVASRVPPARILALCFTGAATFVGLLVAFPGSPEVLWISAAGVGLSLAPMWPNGYNLAVQSVRLTARVGAVIMLGDSVGAMVLPGLTGLFMERAGAGAMMQLVLASVGAAAVASLVIVLVRARLRPAAALPAPEAASPAESASELSGV
jgi:FHS family Na+ dependent glucose MFS transporter 1